MIRFSKALSAAVVAALIGCVVVPDTFEARIYIDIRHIQEQADKLLDYVEGKSETLPEFTPPPADQNSRMSFAPTHFAGLFTTGIAYAAELNESSPLVQQIADSMKSRFADLESVKRSGAVGENNRGFVEVVDASKFSSPDQENEVQRLVAAENEDRRALYKEVARLNAADGVTVSTVEGVYALKRIERASSGDKVQLPPPGENFDTFKASGTGQALGSQCTPGAWVSKP